MASAASPLSYEIGAVFVAAFAVLGALYALNRYLKRRGGELAAREGRGVLDDRSFNQIRIGQAAADRLARSGIDVTAAQMLLARAESARQSGSYDVAIEVAKKAQGVLAAARGGAQTLGAAASSRPVQKVAGGPTPSGSVLGTPAFSPSPPSPARGDPAATPSSREPGPTTPNRPPKNKMEAHFQLSLATEELDRLRGATPVAKNFVEAVQFCADGQAAYDRQEFTEALRLALRSRRALGTRVEALPVSPTPAASPASNKYGDSSSASPTPAAAIDPTELVRKCPQCGKTATTDDRYCRSCGGPIPPSLCSSCAAPLLPGDRFCGVCGAVQT